MCNIPDVQKDVEFAMKHLNDPNFDICRVPSFIYVAEEESTKRYPAGENYSGAIDFDMSVLFYSHPAFQFSNIL